MAARPGVSKIPSVRRRDAIFRRALGLVDVVGAYAALLVAVIVVGRGVAHLRPTALLVAPFVILTAKLLGLYDRDANTLRKTTVDEFPTILQFSIIYALFVWLTEAVLLRGGLGRPEVFSLALATFAFLVVGRSVGRYAALALTPPERCFILGHAAEAARTVRKLSQSPGVKVDVVGRAALGPAAKRSTSEAGTIADISALVRVIAEQSVERVIIAPESHDEDEILHAVRLLKAVGVKVSVLPRLLEVVGSSSTFDEIDGMTLLGVRQYGLTRSSAWLKRSMDLVGAALLLLFASPVLLALAIAIKLDSPGPVFFRQPRIGRRGQRFQMLKFRSMVREAETIKDQLRGENEVEGGLFKMFNDPRVTRVGRFLRSTSLDELPQLFNVLTGPMSLVGPRPLVPDEDALISGWQRRRLALKPGMTGLWQIYGSFRIPIPEMVKIDYLYGANWSAWLDLKILLRTVPYVLRRKGA